MVPIEQSISQGYKAGLVLWWNQYSHATVTITAVPLGGCKHEMAVVYRKPTGKAGSIAVSTSQDETKSWLAAAVVRGLLSASPGGSH